ncbi:MAG TPA: hypothetical protein PK600_07165, partial [Deltaproteobacteria bacterium]|nr:hypothetical protein [Deltaproteobacteria bacterium]
VSSGEVSIKGLFGSSRIAVGEISRLDGITMGSRQFISISTKKRNYLVPNSFDDFPGIIDALRALAPEEAVGADLVLLRGNVVNRRSDVTMGWITVILLAIIVFIRFFPR